MLNQDNKLLFNLNYSLEKMMKIAWGVTGAGHLLLETFSAFDKISKSADVSVFFSKAGEEVANMYGLFGSIHKRFKSFYLESQEGSSFPSSGLFSMGKFDTLVISPTTSNTVAKIAHGISDTLITTIVSQALKGNVPVIIVPTDFRAGTAKTKLPFIVKNSYCLDCQNVCIALDVCKYDAIWLNGDKKAHIDYLKCVGCGDCLIQDCAAISFGDEINITILEKDVENVKKIAEILGITVLEHPLQILEILNKISLEKKKKLKNEDLSTEFKAKIESVKL